MTRISITQENRERIRQAVAEAESKTSGEIAVAVSRESDDYAAHELMFAVLCGFVYFTVMMFFAHGIENTIKEMSWVYSVDYLLIFYGFSTFLVIFLFYLLANLPFIDRLIVPARVRRQRVRAKALCHFMESGIINTADRTGVLIFVSSQERRVELLADSGISALISQEKWDKLVSHIVTGLKQGKFIDHLCGAIRECGDLLAGHFPRKAGDVNELKDDVHILEKR